MTVSLVLEAEEVAAAASSPERELMACGKSCCAMSRFFGRPLIPRCAMKGLNGILHR